MKIFNRFRENISKSSNCFNERNVFCPEINFLAEFYVVKRSKISMKQFFSTYLSKVEENLIMPSGRGYLVTLRKIF